MHTEKDFCAILRNDKCCIDKYIRKGIDMATRSKVEMEYRSYELPAHFPLRIIHGADWRLSDIPSKVLHFHNCLEIGLCESESGTLRFQDKDFPFRAGDVTILSPDMPHTTFSAAGTASKWSYLFLDLRELLRPLATLDSLPCSGKYEAMLYNFRAIYHADQQPSLRLIIQEVLREAEDAKLNYEITIRALLLTFFSKLIREQSLTPTTHVPDALCIMPALKQIHEHYMDDFGMCSLAELCLMSSSHFRRVFVDIMGFGPLEHLNRTRIQKACTLLRLSDQSVLTISEAVGFRSQSSFNRHFAAVMGEAPSSWRKRMNADQGLSIHKYDGWLHPDTPRA